MVNTIKTSNGLMDANYGSLKFLLAKKGVVYVYVTMLLLFLFLDFLLLYRKKADINLIAISICA